GIDHSEPLREAIANAKSILYIGDNAGEIVLDRLFLETIVKENVFFGVRGSAILNDVTADDAQFVGLDHLVTIISNGDNTPGTFLEDTSSHFRAIFEQVDLIIAKGQGNFEGLYQVNRPLFFLLTAKCEVVANVLGVSKGSFVVKKR
ncbi:ARMT1-like domain-containing protein, partial [candidate division KSB1 bacterium]|nr:ARMT1-like domain-containing protein [candidate division KSB1 bacterium]